MTSISILAIGDFHCAEFAGALRELCEFADVTRAATIERATSMLARMQPHLIVIAQARPGQFSAAALDGLHSAAPLARIVGLLGTWCEGEVRTGHPWPGMSRVYWHKWLPRWSSDLRRMTHSQLPSWALPETATEDDRLAVAGDVPARASGLVAVWSVSVDMADMLCAACRAQGFATVWLDARRPVRAEGASAVLWDGTSDRSGELVVLQRMFPSSCLVALVDFPRLHDVLRAQLLGASVVLSKPLSLGDLFEVLDRCGHVSDREAAPRDHFRFEAA